MKRWALSLALLAACGGPKPSNDDAGVDAGASPYIAGFDPPAPTAGFTRYVTPVVDIDPGQSEIWCQYVSAPFDSDQDVVAVEGYQSRFGHHIAAYASTTAAPVGTSRFCTTDDMLAVRFLGGIGAEGSGGLDSILPKGVVFRIHKGEVLLLNTHFINTTPQAQIGEGVMDFEFQGALPGDQVAGLFTNVDDQFTLQPNDNSPQSADMSCIVQQDMDLFAAFDHMHNLGVSIYTELIQSDGGTVPLVTDQTWSAEQEFNPTWATWPESAPLVIHKGDTVHTHCDWVNTTGSTVQFPIEMCVGGMFYLPPAGSAEAPKEIDCVDGQWPTN